MTTANTRTELCTPGTPVQVNDSYGTHIGIVDELFANGQYGFVTSTDSMWIGRMVSPGDVTILEEPEQVEQARVAALKYFVSELNSLTHRKAMNYEQDQKEFWKKRINESIHYCETWIDTLTEKTDII